MYVFTLNHPRLTPSYSRVSMQVSRFTADHYKKLTTRTRSSMRYTEQHLIAEAKDAWKKKQEGGKDGGEYIAFRKNKHARFSTGRSNKLQSLRPALPFLFIFL